jgi:uncharacterized membrane protein
VVCLFYPTGIFSSYFAYTMLLDKIILRDKTIKRHIAKTISWRVIGTLDTMVLGWFVTGNPFVGLKIGALELFTKMILYFCHERAWHKFTRNEKPT